MRDPVVLRNCLSSSYFALFYIYNALLHTSSRIRMGSKALDLYISRVSILINLWLDTVFIPQISIISRVIPIQGQIFGQKGIISHIAVAAVVYTACIARMRARVIFHALVANCSCAYQQQCRDLPLPDDPLVAVLMRTWLRESIMRICYSNLLCESATGWYGTYRHTPHIFEAG